MRLLNEMLNLSPEFSTVSVADSAKSYLIWNYRILLIQMSHLKAVTGSN